MQKNGTVHQLLRPADLFTFDVGRKIHEVHDNIFVLNLQQDLYGMFPQCWYACMIRGCGKGAWAPSSPWIPFVIGEEQRDWLRDLVVRLNIEMHHGGHWFGAWGNTNHFEVFFRDKDGDLQLTNGQNVPFSRMKALGHDAFINHCQVAIDLWRDTLKQMEIKPQDTVKAAQGQTRPDQ